MDPQGAFLPGVTVVATNEASGQYRETVSSTDGTFSMIALTPGMYEVTATLSGFKKYQRGARARRGRQGVRRSTSALAVGGVEESGHGDGGVAARRHLVEADRRRRHARRS